MNSESQLCLDFESGPRQPQKPAKVVNVNLLGEWAFLYTATSTGANSGIHFMMTLPDAKKWCSNPISKGSFMGSEWAYFYTTVENFAFCHWGGNHSTNPQKGVVDLRKLNDNGKWDEKIYGAGCRKYGKQEIKRILEPMGIEVLI